MWLLPQKGGYPARGERVRELLVALTELRLAERRTADPGSLSRLGLDEPGARTRTALLLRVLDGAGAPIAELVVGRRRTRTQAAAPGSAAESAYVRRPEGSQSYLAEGRLPVDADPRLWLDREVANLPEERVRAGGRAARRPDRGAPPRRGPGRPPRPRLSLPRHQPPTRSPSTRSAARMEGLTLLDVRPEAEAPGEPAGEGRFTLTDNLAITARLRQADGEVWLTLAAAGDDEAARLNARWRGWAYQVGAWKLPAFAPSLETLRRREG